MKTSIGFPLGSGGTGQAGGGAKGSGGAEGFLATCVHVVTPQLLRRDLIGSHAELSAPLTSTVDAQWTLSGHSVDATVDATVDIIKRGSLHHFAINPQDF